jgi:hypothetical protein
MDDKTTTNEVFTTRDTMEVEDVCFSNLCWWGHTLNNGKKPLLLETYCII